MTRFGLPGGGRSLTRLRLFLGIAVSLATLAGPVVSASPGADWRFATVPVPGGVARLERGACGLGQALVVTAADGTRYRLDLTENGTALRLLGACPAPPAPAGMLPDGVVATAPDGIARAWLSEPTTRYTHGALGDAVEAGALTVRTRAGATLVHRLDARHVFEDRQPRIVDADGDGLAEEVLVVRSALQRGAGLALYGVREGALRLLAASAPIGLPHRWMNPAGVGDFDGDGRPELAAVVTPHLGGTLTLYAWRGRDLVAQHRAPGFSNHAIGTRELGLATVIPQQEGPPALLLPDASRRTLRLVGFPGGTFRQWAAWPQPAGIRTAILTAGAEGGQAVAFGLADGTLLVARW